METATKTSRHLTIVNPPKFAWMRDWDCQECGHETIKHPVFLSDGRAVGTGCAAKILGWSTKRTTGERDNRLAVVQAQVSADEERRNRYAAALADYRAKGSAIVREGEHADFNRLRCEHGRRDENLFPPAAFAAWLETRIAQLEA